MDRDPHKQRVIRTKDVVALVAAGTVLAMALEGGLTISAPTKEVGVNCASPDINQRARVFRISDESVSIVDGVDVRARLDAAAGGIAVDTMVARPWSAGDVMSSVQSSTVPGVSVEVYNGYQAGNPSAWHDTDPSGMITVRCSNADGFAPVALGDGQ